MITLKDWMEAVNYRITEGTEYFPWGLLRSGETAYVLDSWDGEQDGVSSSVVFSPKDQTVIQVTVCDYKNGRAYRLVNRSVCDAQSIELDKEAWDNVDYIDLETDVDLIEKLTAIMTYQPYDQRIQVELTVPQEDINTLMEMAHQRDITLNQLVEQLLVDEIKRRDPSFIYTPPTSLDVNEAAAIIAEFINLGSRPPSKDWASAAVRGSKFLTDRRSFHD
jgi:hypothetical protein